MRNISFLLMSNEFSECILVTVLLSWIEIIPLVYSQSWRVYLTRYNNVISATPIRVASSYTIWALTSYQFVPMNEGVITKNSVIWEVSLGHSMKYSYIMGSTQSRSNSETLATSYILSQSLSRKKLYNGEIIRCDSS